MELMQNLRLLESISVAHPISSRPIPSSSRLPARLSRITYFSYAKHARRRRSTTVSPHFRPHSILSLLLFLQHHSLSDGSKTLPSLTQPRPYLASRRPRHPHQISTVFQHTCGLRFSDRRPVPFVSLLFTGLEGQLASMEMTRKGMESHHHVADDMTSLRAGVDSQVNGLEKF